MDVLPDIVSAFFNSAVGFFVSMLAFMIVGFYLMNRIVPLSHAWQRYEGTIITAIKLAEKAIPHDTPDAGLQKLNHALKFVLNAYYDAHDCRPSRKMTRELKEGIQIKHAELQRNGDLSAVKH
jgi:hypothetical protein